MQCNAMQCKKMALSNVRRMQKREQQQQTAWNRDRLHEGVQCSKHTQHEQVCCQVDRVHAADEDTFFS